MARPLSLLVGALTFVLVAPAHSASLYTSLARELASLLTFYEQLRSAPELSHLESATSTAPATQLDAASFQVTVGFGKYAAPGSAGHRVVAVLENGQGPTLLIRADLDGLPVAEKTGLPYASRVRRKRAGDGRRDARVVGAASGEYATQLCHDTLIS